MGFSFKKTILILVAVLATNSFLSYLNRVVFDNNLLTKILAKILLILATYLLIKKIDLGYQLKIDRKTLIYSIISFLLILFSFYTLSLEIEARQLDISYYGHFIFLASCFFVGLFEELFFRVLIFFFVFKLLKKYSNYLIKSILLTSIIFGVAHFSNFLNPDYLNLSIFNQVLFATSIGILFQCIFIKYNSIILIVSLHALVNYFGTYKSKLFQITTNNEVTYSFDDFISTFISIILITLVFIVPLSYVFIKDKIPSHNRKAEV